jgi:putative addiction module component (TIGR02574 family)
MTMNVHQFIANGNEDQSDDRSVEEQIDHVQALWDRPSAPPEQIPLPEWQKAILDERLDEMEQDPEEGMPWEEFRDRLLAERPDVRQ